MDPIFVNRFLPFLRLKQWLLPTFLIWFSFYSRSVSNLPPAFLPATCPPTYLINGFSLNHLLLRKSHSFIQTCPIMASHRWTFNALTSLDFVNMLPMYCGSYTSLVGSLYKDLKKFMGFTSLPYNGVTSVQAELLPRSYAPNYEVQSTVRHGGYYLMGHALTPFWSSIQKALQRIYWSAHA